MKKLLFHKRIPKNILKKRMEAERNIDSAHKIPSHTEKIMQERAAVLQLKQCSYFHDKILTRTTEKKRERRKAGGRDCNQRVEQKF